MVFPSPTSSATSQRNGHSRFTVRQTHNWCGSNWTRDREKTPHCSLTDEMASAWARTTASVASSSVPWRRAMYNDGVSATSLDGTCSSFPSNRTMTVAPMSATTRPAPWRG